MDLGKSGNVKHGFARARKRETMIWRKWGNTEPGLGKNEKVQNKGWSKTRIWLKRKNVKHGTSKSGKTQGQKNLTMQAISILAYPPKWTS